mmetsp:Transcript_20451/g.70818  ORF Transcript_20451/g.70818 Transcript_20451/m.70818 type:complete len:583 (+) Transcript_20451:115-1863(+)|eukprot:CAMPEP_0203932872 /NCGR_PEP_ID=MMETSP0359-20131031/71163_1 /ASSEMBLY_ACC=CAM_ASM_000338 /TAXON_ID=268821 /ORGANISM="Scrippsiella Hangoei, Strain SHTV-5" /LENGTH=582 /DNA_ID=CAMNT_0050862365 /DNA_START=88 /DNA_END=1836 /DNA_ORIENTATION=-
MDGLWQQIDGEALPIVTIGVLAETAFGEQVRLVGEGEALGNWRPELGLALSASPTSYPAWTLASRTAALGDGSKVLQFKFVIVADSGVARWETGPNRTLFLPTSGRAVLATAFGEQPDADAQALKPPTMLGCLVMWDVVCARTAPGDELVVVGSSEELGAWDPRRGVVLSSLSSAFPKWSGSAWLKYTDPEESWKLVIRSKAGAVEWEDGENRPLPGHSGQRPLDLRIASGTFGDSGEAHESLVIPKGRMGKKEPSFVRQWSSISDCSTSFCRHMTSTDDDASVMSGGSTSLGGTPTREAVPPKLWSGATCLGKLSGQCEDAHFVTEQAIGVADGVGSMSRYAKYGVDTAAYAAELMERAAHAIAPGGSAWSETNNDYKGRPPPDVLAAAAVRAAEAESTSFGASTISVLQLTGSNIGVANLGDSGFMVLHQTEQGFEIVTRSTEQQHGWNFPYQLMRLPPTLGLSAGAQSDSAADCDCYQFPVRVGDLVLLYSDGLADNLFECEILEVIDRMCTNARQQGKGSGALADPELLSRSLARAAQVRSWDTSADSPFSVAARQQGQAFSGGKEDDITVVAAWVVP